MRAAKVDANQPVIVETFRELGCTIQHLHMLGEGVPDLLIGIIGLSAHNWNVLVEVKTPHGELNERQQKWHAAWCGPIEIIRTPEEAVEMVTRYRQA